MREAKERSHKPQRLKKAKDKLLAHAHISVATRTSQRTRFGVWRQVVGGGGADIYKTHLPPG